MFLVDIQDFTSLPNKDSKIVLYITAPSDDDVEKLLDVRKYNILRWLCCYKTVEDQK
jgi:DNA-dependent RNA polymerase auxiliary subunit epsilon